MRADEAADHRCDDTANGSAASLMLDLPEESVLSSSAAVSAAHAAATPRPASAPLHQVHASPLLTFLPSPDALPSSLNSAPPVIDVQINRFSYRQQHQQHHQQKPLWSTAIRTSSHSTINKPKRDTLPQQRPRTAGQVLSPSTAVVGLRLSEAEGLEAKNERDVDSAGGFEGSAVRGVANVASYDTSFGFGSAEDMCVVSLHLSSNMIHELSVHACLQQFL